MKIDSFFLNKTFLPSFLAFWHQKLTYFYHDPDIPQLKLLHSKATTVNRKNHGLLLLLMPTFSEILHVHKNIHNKPITPENNDNNALNLKLPCILIEISNIKNGIIGIF